MAIAIPPRLEIGDHFSPQLPRIAVPVLSEKIRYLHRLVTNPDLLKKPRELIARSVHMVQPTTIGENRLPMPQSLKHVDDAGPYRHGLSVLVQTV